MKVSKQQAAANRERILEEAARLFRERGIAGVGVDALAEAAGMTHGSLYSQFGSKERLAAEAIDRALTASAERAGRSGGFAEYVASYLSERHRDSPGGGCAVAALGGEVARQGESVRKTYTAGVSAMAKRLAALLPADEEGREDAALAAAATLVGALVLARAVDDPALSERILKASREALAGSADRPRRTARARGAKA